MLGAHFSTASLGCCCQPQGLASPQLAPHALGWHHEQLPLSASSQLPVALRGATMAGRQSGTWVPALLPPEPLPPSLLTPPSLLAVGFLLVPSTERSCHRFRQIESPGASCTPSHMRCALATRLLDGHGCSSQGERSLKHLPGLLNCSRSLPYSIVSFEFKKQSG
ncbi:apoptosis regulatory protein Siva [Platysternon megacephalum]|uniref:Apoptosis regulatory protein Siva n=1 Tax=Platysternon megacephalum TaxID=55544 RepID=A0A4D9EY38_9SAUR|nr:apoptosis regulatory protein Siva [Platysternon megacephalum]